MTPVYTKCDKSITVVQLKQILDKHKVEYKKSAKKDELCRLVEKCLKKQAQAPTSPKQGSPLPSYTKCDKSITVAQLKKILDKHKAEYKKSAKKEELCRLVEKCLKKAQSSSPKPPQQQKKQALALPVYTKCDKSITVDKLKTILDHHKVEYKKTAKKNELCSLVEKLLKKARMQQQSSQKQKVQVVVKQKKSQTSQKSDKIRLSKDIFNKKKMVDLGVLGKYRCMQDENEKHAVIHHVSHGKPVAVPKSRQTSPKIVNVMDGDSILTDDLEVGDIVNLGDYRLHYAYYVNKDKQGHKFLSPIMAEEDQAIIPFYITELWENPEKAYEHIDDIDILEMVVPHPFLDAQFGLESQHQAKLKSLLFHYSPRTGDLDVMLEDGGKAFTVEPGEAEGQELVQLIKQELKL